MKLKFALHKIACFTLLAVLAAGAKANIISDNWSLATFAGSFGTLRAGSPWTVGTLSYVSAFDGAFVAEGTDWNNGTAWWDQDPSVNPDPVSITIQLNAFYAINHMIVQADNNDTYAIRYRDGGGIWHDYWTIDSLAGYGMMTRDSGILGSIVTDAIEFTAVGGDNYYSVSEIQAFGTAVPEPATLSLISLGLLAYGFSARRKGN
jgi:hypothetical protein